jgi:hypothetical protein
MSAALSVFVGSAYVAEEEARVLILNGWIHVSFPYGISKIAEPIQGAEIFIGARTLRSTAERTRLCCLSREARIPERASAVVGDQRSEPKELSMSVQIVPSPQLEDFRS